MKKNIIRFWCATIYLIVGIIGIVVSLGGFSGKFDSFFFLFYTNLSNYLCFLYILIEYLYNSYFMIKNKTINYITLQPTIKFALCIDIFITLIFSNTILSYQLGYIWTLSYWTNLINPFLHLVLPMLYMINYFAFSDHRYYWKSPLYGIVFPALYLIFIFIRAGIIGKDYQGIIYPYFFLDINQNGIGITILYIILSLLCFLFVGYAIIITTKYLEKKKN